MMVYTVTLNPALDCFITPAAFAPGQINRYESPVFLPGGKGINVSLLLHSLGVETAALGIAAGFTGRQLAAMLEQQGCPASFLFLEQGLTRLNLKLLPENGEETALNGSGPPIPSDTLDQLEQQLAVLLRAGDFLVLSGSLPGSLPADTYLRLAKAVPPGVRTILDTSGKALELGLQAKPFLIKPNLEELEELFGLKLRDRQDIEEYAGRLLPMGAQHVLLSMGSQGALLFTGSGQVLERKSLSGTEVSSVGAGDSMVAGFLYGWLQTGAWADALDWGIAAGAATAFTQGIASGKAVRELYEKGRQVDVYRKFH